MNISSGSTGSGGHSRAKAIDSLGLFNGPQIEALRSHWIETVEQGLAATATPEGRDGMARLLCVSDDELQEIVVRLAQELPSEIGDKLMSAEPGGPLGAMLEEGTHDETEPSDGGNQP